MDNLQILDLESNLLSSLPGPAFKHLKSLRILTVNNNPITHLGKNDFKYLSSIETLKFENCQIKNIEPSSFRPMNRLYELNLANNQLRHLHYQIKKSFSRLTVLRLYNNQWKCDCHLRWLRISLQSIPNWDFGSNSPICESPNNLRGVSWKNVAPDKFACSSTIQVPSATSVEVVLGSNATLKCTAWGDPAPIVTWFMKNEQLNENYNNVFDVNEGEIDELNSETGSSVESVLHVLSAKKSDAGSYMCLAENLAGKSEVMYNLLV
ncbi:hypothetical protein HELRODRAFT_73506, partial [Helobdella robusta]|uniref:Ig-like domain-containing protein n=1 Tax=Helobdella robusta TaxID=6412 RepID=T1G1E9_HELRO